MSLPVVFNFENFWPGFDPEDNFLSRIYLINGKSINKVHSDCAKIILVKSVFENISASENLFRAAKHFLKYYLKLENVINKKKKASMALDNAIFYTGENIRVPMSSRYSLSFCFDEMNGRNIYYPLIFDTLLISKLGHRDPNFGSVIPFQSLTDERRLETKPKKLACIFFSNQTPLRWRLIQEFRKYGEVDVFGRCVDNYLEDRSTLFGDYRYVLCPENDYYPGYVTEKVVHAYAMGSVPIYWGGLTDSQFINRRSILEIDPSDNFSRRVAELANLDDPNYESIFSQRLLLGEPDWKSVYDQIQIWIGSILNNDYS